MSRIPDWIGNCNYIFARPRYDLAQSREPFYIGEKGDTDRFGDHEKLRRALALGATELHVRFAARSRWERLDIETDLRNGHWTPLNQQPARALEAANALGALTAFGLAPANGIFGALSYLSQNPAPSYGGGIAGLAAALQPGNALALKPQNSLGALARALGTSR